MCLSRFLSSRIYPQFLALFFISRVACSAADSAPTFIWIEGENTSAVEPAGAKVTLEQGPVNVLSGGKWMKANIDAGSVDAAIPASGIILSYAANVSSGASYDLWMHIGFELVRSPFDWRIDQGAWQTVKPTDYTIDLQEIGVWAPVAWIDLGKQNLTAGNHTVQIHLSKLKDKDGQYQRILFSLDCLCLSAQPFHPDGVIKPGDTSWMTDADKAAATQTFEMPAPTSAAQAPLSLAGPWQYADDDEFVVDDRLGPVKSIPSADSMTWHALVVPGDRNTEMPDQTYVHRFDLRTRVKVPAELADHSFILHVPSENMIATVFVNGQQCGWTKDCFTVWDCDVTKAIKPGQVNDIWVAFKDLFYGLSDPDDSKHLIYFPFSFWSSGQSMKLDMPVLYRFEAGFPFNAPSLVAAGRAYTSDVFAKPSVQNKTLGLDVTLHNPTGAVVNAQLTNEIQPLAGGAAEKTFASRDVSIPAGQDLLVPLSEPWQNPKLWWPDDPQQYNVVTRLSVGGKVIDERITKFGFREWTWDGPNFKINGMPFHGFADINPLSVDGLLKKHESMLRVWTPDDKTEALLDECDAKGMPVRRTGIFDGQGAGYTMGNPALFDNYREQLVAWVKGQRNHPSIFIWSMENEITFINGHVFGQDAITTKEMKKAADMVAAVDPTRPEMTDGGNANLDESLPVYGGHYMEPPFNTFPEGCYDRAGFAHRQVWPVTKDKPVLLGESAFLPGDSLGDIATVGGEQTFLGGAESKPGKAMVLRMLSEGYRWNDVNFTFWTSELPSYYNAWSPVAVLCRQWDWTFGSGDQVKRTFGIFNNTRSTDPITFIWNLSVNGKKVTEGNSTHHVAPGMNEKFEAKLSMPEVETRKEGILTLSLTQGGKEVFNDTKEVSILPRAAVSLKSLGVPAAGRVAVFDPEGSVKTFLTSLKIPFSEVSGLNTLPSSAKVLIIGRDGLDATASTSSSFAGWASFGKVVILLEQKNSLKFQGLPGKMEPAENAGSLGFPDDISSPILADLKEKDFIDWGSDGILYRNAYSKPTSGGKSIIQCDLNLANSGIIEMSSGDGALLLSQLTVAENLKTSVVAQRLLLNMLNYADHFKLTYLNTVAAADSNPPLKKALDAIGLKYESVSDAATAIAKPGQIAILDATPASLKTLASDPARIKAFTGAGGWIILNNLTPDGLSDFDKLVGVDHIIRPFHAEKVTWPKVRTVLSAGISGSDIALGTGHEIVPWRAGEWPDANSFSYVVDLDDIAPFGTSTYSKWDNAINNFTQADGAWQLIQNDHAKNFVVPITLPRPEKILQFTWVSDLNYSGTTKIQVTINGKDYAFATQPNGDPQTFDIPDQPTTADLMVKILAWQPNPKLSADAQDDVGLDNIYIKVARPDSFYQKVKPFLNIGAIVEYPMGKGGILLCNIKFSDSEENLANIGKKRVLLSGILHNLKAPFSGGKAIIAGGNLVFTPIDISKQANQFKGETGWFGDKEHTFADLPSGKQILANVTYDIYHFTTSVVPEAIMLGGTNIPGNLPQSVTGIPVNKIADALFFLQAARIDAPRNPDEVKNNTRYEMADYVIHYADGTDQNVPIYSEISVDDYLQKSLTPIAKAQIAWTSPYRDGSGYAVAYSMQWDNPHPNIEIKSIDLIYGPDRRGIPALLAITAAKDPTAVALAPPVISLAAPIDHVTAANVDASTLSSNANWDNVSSALTKQIGVDEADPAFFRRCNGLIVTPTGDLVMQTSGKGVCVSRDQGATWSVVPDNKITGRCQNGFGVSIAYPYDGRMAFFCYDGSGGTAGGMSLDGAKTWKPFSQFQRGMEFADVDWNTRASQAIYGMTHEPYFSLFSNNGGTSWQRLDKDETGGGAEIQYSVGIIDGTTLTRYNPSAEGGIIELSDDVGQTWTQVAEYRVQGRRPVHYGRNVYWTTSRGVITSSNGKDWTLTGNGAEGALYGPYFGSSEQEFVVVTDKYFLKTQDGGKTWKPIAKVYTAPDMFRSSAALSYFGWDAKHNILYASGLGAAVYRLTL
jgi:hypothetical protein